MPVRAHGVKLPAWAAEGLVKVPVGFGRTTRKEAEMGFTEEDAKRIGAAIGIDWATAPFDVEQYRMGLGVELEHGLHDPQTNVTDDDETATGKIALAHLKEFSDYYTRLERMEKDAKEFWGG
jgi:Protein of unknown function (DUF5661)